MTSFPRFFRRMFVFAAAALAATGFAGAPRWNWPTVAADELNAPPPPDASAEVLEWKILCDQRNEGFWDEYIRLKIHDPVVVEDLTRRTVPKYNRPLTSLIEARVTYPDGRVRLYGEADCKVRKVLKYGTIELEEQTLSLPQIEAGCVVEFRMYRDLARITRSLFSYSLDDSIWWRGTVFQTARSRLRHAEIRWMIPPDDYWDSRLFAINAAGAKVQRVSKRELKFEVRDLPPLGTEPATGPLTEIAATLIWSSTATTFQNFAPYARGGEQLEVDTHAAGWTPFSTMIALVDNAQGRPTGALRKFAATLCAGAADDTEKARRIHGHVQKLYLAYKQRAAAAERGSFTGTLNALDQLLEPEKSARLWVDPMDYFWLAVSLYRAADLGVSVVLLPDRNLARLQRDQVAPVFLPRLAVAVRIGETMQFSYPLDFSGLSQNPLQADYHYLPFGQLPWNCAGQEGLLAVANEEKFIPVPPPAPAQSKITSVGVFQLDAEGHLRGQARRSFTGQEAARVRREVFTEPDGKQREFLLEELKQALPGTELEITKLSGMAEPEAAIELEFKVKWPGFAAVAGDRLIFRPSLFRRELPAMFPAEKRRHPVQFPFPHEQMDSVGIQLPAGFKPEELPAPTALPGGKALSVGVKFGFDENRRLLTVRRDYASSVLEVPVEAYPKLKGWYDALAALDQQEVVFVRRDPAAP